MKKQLVIAGIGLLAILGCTGIVYAVQKGNQEEVKVVSVQEMSGWYGDVNTFYMSGMITSDVSQTIYLDSTQTVNEVYVTEGQEVHIGDPLISYDMTLKNLELEMKKLDKEGILLNIQKANRELTKLKNTKPISESGGDEMIDLPGEWIEEDPEESEEPEVFLAYAELDEESEPYMGQGTVEDPYHYLCTDNGVILGSFLNEMAKSQCFFVVEIREGNVSNGELLKIWGQKIQDENLELDPEARYEMELNEIEKVLDSEMECYELLTKEEVDKYYRGNGSYEKPYTYLLKTNGKVEGSFFNALKEKEGYFRIEVWKDDTYGSTLLRAWEQQIESLGDFQDTDRYLADWDKYAEATPGEGGNTGGTTPEEGGNTGGTTPEEGGNTGETTPEEGGNTGETTPEEGGNTGETTPEEGGNTGETMPEEGGNTEEPISEEGSTAAVSPMTYTKTLSNVMYLSVDYDMTASEIQEQIKQVESQLRDYQLDLKEVQLELDKMEKDMKNQTVNSTINGVVKVAQDPQLALESNSSNPLIQVVSSEGLYIQGTVSEMQLDDFTVGQILNGYCYDNGVSFQAEVVEVSPYPVESYSDGSSSVYPFTAYISDATGLSNYSYAELTSTANGMSGGSSVIVEKPFIRSEDGQYYVMKDDGDGHLVKQVVQIQGILYGSSYQISSGLTMQDKIAFPYGKNVKEGAKTVDSTYSALYE